MAKDKMPKKPKYPEKPSRDDKSPGTKKGKR